MRNLGPEQVQLMCSQHADLLLLDVREGWEFETCSIDSSVNIPMNDIPAAINTLNPEQETVVICHHGARSMQVAGFLENAGFTRVVNLDGGIDAWAKLVDPHMQQY